MNLKRMKANRIKLNLENNIDLIDEYNNENMLDSNSYKTKKLMKIKY